MDFCGQLAWWTVNMLSLHTNGTQSLNVDVTGIAAISKITHIRFGKDELFHSPQIPTVVIR